jgi:hypothetical protein
MNVTPRKSKLMGHSGRERQEFPTSARHAAQPAACPPDQSAPWHLVFKLPENKPRSTADTTPLQGGRPRRTVCLRAAAWAVGGGHTGAEANVSASARIISSAMLVECSLKRPASGWPRLECRHARQHAVPSVRRDQTLLFYNCAPYRAPT